MIYFLDLDGVIIDWDRAVQEFHGLEYQPPQHWNDVFDIVGLHGPDFWEPIDNAEFWENLPMFSWAESLLAMMENRHVCLLTSPTIGAAGYRQNWIQKNLPNYFYEKRYLIGLAKPYCARPNAVLIDDSTNNCEGFKECGGEVILFPQPWNKLGKYYQSGEQRLAYLRGWLETLEGED